MSGMGTIYPQSAELIAGLINGGVAETGIVAGQVYQDTPSVGLQNFGGDIPATGIADWSNLLSDSPPTLLERYELVSFQIPIGVFTDNTVSPPASYPLVTAGINFLVNDEVRFTVQTQVQTVASQVTNLRGIGNGNLQGDIINPIRLGARDRLTLQGFFSSNVSMNGTPNGVAFGAYFQTGPASHGRPSDVPYRSLCTLTYNVVDLPAARRL